MKKKWLSLMLLIIAMGLGICAWFLLSDTMVVQVGFDGQATNTMPKLLTILVLVGISAAGSIMNFTHKKEQGGKGLILALVGIAAMILTLLFNR